MIQWQWVLCKTLKFMKEFRTVGIPTKIFITLTTGSFISFHQKANLLRWLTAFAFFRAEDLEQLLNPTRPLQLTYRGKRLLRKINSRLLVSLSLSHAHTQYMLTHTNSLSLKHMNSHTLTPACTCTHTHTCTHTLTQPRLRTHSCLFVSLE